MRGYRPEELFDRGGKFVEELRELSPVGDRRISANPHANGGLLRVPLRLPHFRKYAVAVASPGTVETETTYILGEFLRDVMRANMKNFRVLGRTKRLRIVFRRFMKPQRRRGLPIINLRMRMAASCRWMGV